MRNELISAAALVGGITGEQRLTFDPKAPLNIAREYVRQKHLHLLMRTLHYQNGLFYVWNGRYYQELSEDELGAGVCRFLEGAQRIEGKKLVCFDPTPRRIADVIEMLKFETHLRAATPPFWLDYQRQLRPLPGDLFACRNGLLHLRTRVLQDHTPAFFNLQAVDYDYDPRLPPPREFLKFLAAVWPNENDSIETLQQIFGYILAGDTTQQKAFMLLGPPRAGKGSLARVITKLLGDANVAGPNLASFGSDFGMQSLIGKTLAIIPDARIGRKTDQSGLVERLLSATGEDRLTINRKNKEYWTGTLPTRFLILTNELPRFSDSSGAIVSRFVVLRFQQSFLGREDLGLSDRLLPERPAILNWALDGWSSLSARGRFTQPLSGSQAIEALEDMASPISAFLRDCAEIGPGKGVECNLLFLAWKSWCVDQGRDYPGNLQTFGKDLQAAQPHIRVARPRTPGSRVRIYEGVGLAAAPFLPKAWQPPCE